jgi:hypothetical protein
VGRTGEDGTGSSSSPCTEDHWRSIKQTKTIVVDDEESMTTITSRTKLDDMLVVDVVERKAFNVS